MSWYPLVQSGGDISYPTYIVKPVQLTDTVNIDILA